MVSTKQTVQFLSLLSKLGVDLAKISCKEINKRQSSQARSGYQSLNHEEDDLKQIGQQAEKIKDDAIDAISTLHPDVKDDSCRPL
ncbi:MAG: hypothetical protein Q8R83_08240 [Legionellaceae bacterium]|nr:hypothetical protein [Legionellaceae bacterium]